jgi:hypothetical protein
MRWATRPAVSAGLGAMALVLLTGMSGCESSGEKVLEVAATCKTYATTLRGISSDIRAGRLTPEQEDTVEAIDGEAGPLCEAQSEIAPDTAIPAISRLTARLVALRGQP